MTRRLLAATVAALAGYGLCWADRAYGHTPLALFALVAAVSWLAGATWICSRSVLPLTLAVAEAVKERDDLAARLAQLEDGGTYEPVNLYDRRLRAMASHPSVRSKLPRQDQR